MKGDFTAMSVKNLKILKFNVNFKNIEKIKKK